MWIRDSVIGTHRLLSKDVKFKNLGLLVVDEEQRFGVQHKEALKMLKKNVDVLTLSATPIPRTLHMSLTGIKDMSIIEPVSYTHLDVYKRQVQFIDFRAAYFCPIQLPFVLAALQVLFRILQI